MPHEKLQNLQASSLGFAGNARSAAPEVGGQGLPKALEFAVFERVHSANMAFGLCPLLTQGAIEALSAHGTERQKSLYLHKLIAGTWTGTMNLTEPQAGSDLALLRTRAEPDGNGKYRLYGQKIFITWGDHDAAENIVHLVLARLPDAPEGTRGISLFLAPKTLVNADGSLGATNTLGPVSIEHKLGIHASPTCVLAYEDAIGWTNGKTRFCLGPADAEGRRHKHRAGNIGFHHYAFQLRSRKDVGALLAFLVRAGIGVGAGVRYLGLGGKARGPFALVLPLVSRLLYLATDLVVGSIAIELLRNLSKRRARLRPPPA